MIIRTKLTEKDVVQLYFELLYKRWLIRILTIVAILMLLVVVTGYIFRLETLTVQPSNVIIPVVVLVVLPSMTYYGAKKNYKTSTRLHETIEYNFTDEYLEIKGESFSSQMGWNKFYKVSKSKKWLLVYQNNQSANIIPMRDVWESQIDELKDILIKHNVKSNL